MTFYEVIYSIEGCFQEGYAKTHWWKIKWKEINKDVIIAK